MAKIKNTDDSLCWGVCWVKGTFLHCWWQWKLVQLFWKSFWQFLRKLRNNLLQDQATHFWVYTQRMLNYTTRICAHKDMFIAALFVITRTWKQPKCPWRMDKRNVLHLHNAVLHSGGKNNDILKFVGKWMDLENILLSEITQTQKDNYYMYSLISCFET